MNNLASTSQDPSTVGAGVEERVREAVGANAPLPYQVEMGEAATASGLRASIDAQDFFDIGNLIDAAP